MACIIRDVLKEQAGRRCKECKRVFNLEDEIDAQEWYYGHDCEV